MNNFFKRTVGASAAMCLMSSVFAAPAALALAADDDDDTAVAEVLQASPLSPLFADAAAQGKSLDGNVVTVETGITAVSVRLPVSPEAEVKVENGIHSYADADSFSVVPVALSDGSVAVHSVLHDFNSPTEFRYELELEDNAQLAVSPDGGILGVNSDGSLAIVVAPPWAVDAEGRSVPTSYRLEGHTLVQHVAVSGTTAFPVVADPWLGVNLVDSFSFTTIAGQGYRLNVNPTAWARGLTLNPLWVQAGVAGWDELRSRMSAQQRARLNDSGKDQYICHMGFAGTDQQWNMELWKPAKPLGDWVATLCN